MFIPKDGTGQLFPNTNKTSEKHPDKKGKAMVGGKLYDVGVWEKTSAKGEMFLSLSFKPYEAKYNDTKTKPREDINF